MRLLAFILRKAMKMKKKYFLDDEQAETIRGLNHFYNPHANLVRKEYVYKCSGAKYQGEWLGGFRHGHGCMRWEDGAQYEGQWVLGRAFGNGVFTHSKGEIYDGEWRYDKAQGFGVYIHSNGAKYEGLWYQDL